ncbi:MAG: Rrf2 family transcriptional regulator, partial [Candidatus Margulisiibacteriota bacterium]
MQLSTRTRYGLRMLIYLGTQKGNGWVQLHEVAKAEDISVKYLEQIVRLLKPSGLINVARGAKGGYSLAKDPEKVTIKDVYLIMEGKLCIVDCSSGGSKACLRTEHCATVEVWRGLEKIIDKYFSGITLAQLIEEGKKKEAVKM